MAASASMARPSLLSHESDWLCMMSGRNRRSHALSDKTLLLAPSEPKHLLIRQLIRLLLKDNGSMRRNGASSSLGNFTPVPKTLVELVSDLFLKK